MGFYLRRFFLITPCLLLLCGPSFAACAPGDISGNCIVNISDILILAEQWLDDPGCAGHPDDCADIVGSDGVDLGDFVVIADNWLEKGEPVIINEIHHNPDVKTEWAEFIELHNILTIPIDISGWHFCDGIVYTFPGSTIIPAGGYIVVTEDSATIQSKFGVSAGSVYGPYIDSLDNNGEKIELCNSIGKEMNQVDYNLGFPWPTVGDAVPDTTPGTGHSIQLLNEDLDNDLGGSWRSAYPTPGAASNKRLKYEIDAVWQSDELTVFSNTIRIPASNIKQDRTYRVRCKMEDNTGRWSHWSTPVQFIATESIAAHILDNLRVTEIMYNPVSADIPYGELDIDNNEFEFLELKNTGSFNLDLSSLSFTDGITFDFALGDIATLLPGEFVLVVKNKTAFESRYGTSLSSRIAGQFTTGSLSNSGENVALVDYWNGTIISFTYNDSRGWPLAADGAGHSMIPLDTAIEDEPLGTLEYGGNWRQSSYINGSPAADDPAAPAKTVVINEIMAHTDHFVAPHESNDWIELYNTTGASVALGSDWYLSDDPDDLKKYALPSGSIIAGSQISFDQITHFNTDGTGPLGFGLDKAGEQILLSYLPGTSADRVIDCVEFKGQENGISLGRYPDGGNFFFAMSPTRDLANAMPDSHVVISEVMYHPLEGTTNEEYIELYNPTGQSVNLWTTSGTFELDGGVDYTFPAATTIANGQKILVVGFDPVIDTARLGEFETTHSTGALTANTDIFGPWAGSLSNNGERITLEKPQEPDLPDPNMSWTIVDEVIYGDFWPWPTTPDSTGSSLGRISTQPNQAGNNPQNWQQQAPTPGI